MQIIYQQILSYQKLSYLRWYNQEDFLVDSWSITKNRITTLKNAIKPLAKRFLSPLGLTAASAVDAGIYKKN